LFAYDDAQKFSKIFKNLNRFCGPTVMVALQMNMGDDKGFIVTLSQIRPKYHKKTAGVSHCTYFCEFHSEMLQPPIYTVTVSMY
jgi:hypothetical protein